MTRKEYLAKRQNLIVNAQAAIDAGDLEKYNSIEADINKLDNDFDQMAKAQASIKALEQPTLHPDAADLFSNAGVSFNGGQCSPAVAGEYINAETGKPLQVFGKGQRMSDAYKNENNLDLGRYIRGAVTGDWSQAPAERQIYGELTTTTGSVLIPTALSANVLDIARDKSILLNAGVPIVKMDAGNLKIAKVATDPDNFGFKQEGADATESAITFDSADLASKTAYGLVSVTLEALESAANLGALLTRVMGEAMARTMDRAFLFGQGAAAHEPVGVLTLNSINTEISAGALTGYGPFIKALGAVRAANGEPTHWAINAATDELINLFTTAEGDLIMDPPRVIAALKRQISNVLPADGGAGSNESTAIVYDPQAMLIGMQANLRVETSREALDAWKKGLVYLRVYAMCDICAIRPEWITKVTGIKGTA